MGRVVVVVDVLNFALEVSALVAGAFGGVVVVPAPVLPVFPLFPVSPLFPAAVELVVAPAVEGVVNPNGWWTRCFGLATGVAGDEHEAINVDAATSSTPIRPALPALSKFRSVTFASLLCYVTMGDVVDRHSPDLVTYRRLRLARCYSARADASSAEVAPSGRRTTSRKRTVSSRTAIASGDEPMYMSR